MTRADVPLPSKNPMLSAQRLAQPEQFRTQVRTALQAQKSIPAAARALQISERTLFRWVLADPALVEGLALPTNPATPRGCRRPRAVPGRALQETLHEHMQNASPPAWIVEMIRHYNETGTVRTTDMHRLLGDPAKGFSCPPRT